MRKSNLISTAFVACGCLLILFAGPATGAVNCDKKPDHPQCNGGGEGGGKQPVNLTFRDDPTDRIGSDVATSGMVTYTDGESGVIARFRDDGIFLLNFDSADRGLELDFSVQSQAPECGTGCRNIVNVKTADYIGGAAVAVQVFDDITSRQHRAGQFLGMNIGEKLLGEMKTGFGGAKNSTRYSVRFQALNGNPLDANIAAKSSFVEISRASQNTWFIEAVDPGTIGGGDQALLISEFKQKGTVFQDEGTYHMAFGLTVTCQSACP